MLRATRTVRLWAAAPAAWMVPLPSATLLALARIPSRRAVDALTVRRAFIVHCEEQMPASFRPRRATRAGLSLGRSVIARFSVVEPATAVRLAPRLLRLRPTARRTLRVMPTFTAPAPAPARLPPRRTVRLPRVGTPSLPAVREDTASDVVREHALSHELSVVSRPAAASRSDSSVAKTANAGPPEAPLPPTAKCAGELEPLLPAGSP